MSPSSVKDRRRRWRRFAAGLGMGAAALAGASVAFSACTALRLCRPQRQRPELEPPEGAYEDVDFPASDGTSLSGWFLPADRGIHGQTREPSPAAVLCHGFQTSRLEMLPLAHALRRLGHNVLIFDFRAHGKSRGRWSSCGLRERCDLEGAVHYLLSRPEAPGNCVGVVGFSMGASIAILTAAEMEEIGAVVADSAFATLKNAVPTALRAFYHLPRFPFAPLTLWFAERLVGASVEEVRPVDAIAAIAPRPVLLIHNTGDRIVALKEAYRLFDTAREPREIWTIAARDHVGVRAVDFDGYVARIDAFLRKALVVAEAGGEPSSRGDGSSRS